MNSDGDLAAEPAVEDVEVHVAGAEQVLAKLIEIGADDEEDQQDVEPGTDDERGD
jgi:hypothetical protein